MRLLRKIAAACLAATVLPAVPVLAQDADATPRDEPTLLVVVSVDQFSADLFAQYRSRFTGGLARLLNGAVFPSAFQSHAATETCPGHSTIGTGVRPARNGIVANNWFVPGIARADKQVYCAEDESDPQSTSRDPVVSAVHLRVPTLADRIKQADPKSRNVAVAGKDRAVVMMGGKTLDAGYWWGKTGFATFRGREMMPEVAKANALYARSGMPGNSQLPDPDWCGARKRAVPVGDFSVGDTRFKRPGKPGDPAWISPWMDVVVTGMAINLIDALDLGRDDHVDVLSVGLSATDYIGHAYGSEGYEMCVQMAQLDRNLANLFDALDRRKIDYVVALTADHGGLDAPERVVEQGYPRAARAAAELDTDALGKEMTKLTGIAVSSGPLLYGGMNGDLYLSAQLTSEQKAKVTKALVDRLVRHPQVAEVYTAAQLAEMPLPTGSPQDWTLPERARASFDAKRSGDVVVLLERAILPAQPRPGYVATHGSPWDYDRRVPLVFWRKGIAGFEQAQPVETVDLAPTLAALIGLKVPENAFDGRCLDIDGGTDNTCQP